MRNNVLLLFDLDGTLTDPGLGITNAVMYALRRYGRPVPPREALYPFIGPPLTDSFERYCGFSKEEAVRAVEVYREYFRDQGIFENEVYPGVEALLQNLRAAGKRIALATSKPEVFAKRILEHFELAGYFDIIVGSELDGRRVKKVEVIREVLRTASVAPQEALMIGDRSHDVEGARTAGIDCVGVAYGYGSRAELEAAGAVKVVESVEELWTWLMGD